MKLLHPWQYLEGSYEIGSVRPSVLLSILLSRHFPGIISLVFLNFGMVPETHMKFCVAARSSGKKNFAPKYGKMDQKCVKNTVF